MTASPIDSDGASVTGAPGIYPGPGSATGLRYWNGAEWDPRPVARTWTRVWCNVIDNVLASIVWIVLALILLIPFVLLDPSGENPLGGGISILGLIVGFVGYFSVSYRLWGRTPGMMLGRLYVVHIPTGQSRLTWGTAIGRAAGLILGYACGIFTLIWLVTTASSRTKQGPHDSWARTGVLVDPPSGPGTTHLVSGSAASLAAGRQSASPAPPSSPPARPPTSGSAGPQPQAQAGPDPVTDRATAAAPPDGVRAEQRPSPADVGAGPRAAPDDQQELEPQLQRQRSRLPLVLGSVVAGVVLLAGAVFALIYIDSRIKAAEMNNLISATAKAQGAISSYVNNYRWSVNEEALAEAQATSGREQEFYQEAWRVFVYDTTDAARAHVVPLQMAILDVEAVSVLPWHTDIEAARQAYLDHADVWMKAVMQRTTHEESAQRIYGPTENLDAEIDSTEVVAERRYEDVSILFAPKVISVRISGLFV